MPQLPGFWGLSPLGTRQVQRPQLGYCLFRPCSLGDQLSLVRARGSHWPASFLRQGKGHFPGRKSRSSWRPLARPDRKPGS